MLFNYSTVSPCTDSREEPVFEHITTTAMGQPTRVEQKAYIGDAAVLTETRIGDGLPSFKIGFLHKDRLGSTFAVTDADGKEIEWHAFDAFGQPLNGDLTSSGGLLNTASTVEAYSATDNPGATTRGFTGHEHLDDVQLIHMNGRAYDPSLGRFLSVDPFIQGNGNSQGLNPYSYILNNPLAGTDPTGYLACDPGAHQCGGLPWTETGMGRGITRNGYICSGMGRPCVPTFSSGDEGNGSESGTQPGNTSGTTGDQVEQIAELNSPTRTEAMVDYGDLGVSLQRGEHTPGRYVLTARAPVKEAELKGELKSLGLDLLPVIGSFKAVVQLVTGRDAVTGERVSRAGELFGILLGLVPGGRTAQKAPKIIRVGERLAARHSNVLSPSAIVREVEREVTKDVSNPVPGTLARVVPDNPITRATGTLGKPGANDVFVTAADDIRGLSAKQIAERLTIPESPSGFRVIEFPTPKSGIASPVNRADPGFIGGGRTAGGAREFVIPNGPIPAGSSTRVVK